VLQWDLGAHRLSLVRAAGELGTSILFTMVWNRSRDLELNALGPFIGSKQTRFADVGAEGGYNGEEEESEESQEVEVNSRS
jgi:hypothetical protein